MALSPDEQKVYDRLQMRFLSSRLAKSGRKATAVARQSPPAPEKPAEIAQSRALVAEMRKLTNAVVDAMERPAQVPTVVVNMPEEKEAPEAPVMVAPPPTPAPIKQWKFSHKYDEYNKIIETTAVAT